MRTIKITLLLSLIALFAIGCDDDDNMLIEDAVPATPQGVYSVTGDQQVWIYWNGIYERDVSEYVVYRSGDAVTGYTEIATVAAVDNPSLDLLIYEYADNSVSNGDTYYYAVTAVDRAGQESELSAENVFDTPRPDGVSSIFPVEVDSTLAGFNLETGQNVVYNSAAADVWIDTDLIDGDITYLNAGSLNTDIQDLGYTSDIDEISWAPSMGWSQLGYVEIVLGHTYVIWTTDDHFAKMRAAAINASGSITFEWAWQSVIGNPELAPALKPLHRAGYLKARPGVDERASSATR